jgi:hypothetical protein
MPWRGPGSAVEPATDWFFICAGGSRSSEDRAPRRFACQKEKDQLALAQCGDKLCTRPDPDDPGGLGAEESGIERTGPTQWFLLAIQQGVRWAEVGRYYDSG